MSVVANLVIGADGSSTMLGSSTPISSPADRERFLRRRRESDCIIIGGNTARNEGYIKSPGPVAVISHTRPGLLDQNRQSLWWNLSPEQTLARAIAQCGPRIRIEGGVALMRKFLALGLIDVLELSVTSVSGGENRIELSTLLSHFKIIEEEMVEQTHMYTCSQPLRAQK